MSSRRETTWRVLRIIAAVLALYLAAVMGSRSLGKMTRPGDNDIFGPRPDGPVLNIAHQGGNLERPDETEESFRNGLAVGADVLEFDLHLSADNYLIAIHDPEVDRTTDGSGRIADMTLPEIKSLDAGYWWPCHSNDDVAKLEVPAGQEFPWRGRGLVPLTFEEILDMFPGTPMVVELKSGGADAAVTTRNILARTGRSGDVLVVSSNPEILAAYREAAPDAPTGADRKEVIRFWLLGRFGLSGFAGVKATSLQVPVRQGRLRVITRGFIRRAHRQGLSVHAWTINDADEMERLIAIGVDGIITDRPTTLAGLAK